MPKFVTSFVCPNSHSFTADAKLRARCPECGAMARKEFSTRTSPVSEKPDAAVDNKNKPVKEPVLIRQGKPRIMAARKKVPATPPAPIKVRARTSNGLVRAHTAPKGAVPKVSRPPLKTAIARHVATATGQNARQPQSYMEQMISRFGFRGNIR